MVPLDTSLQIRTKLYQSPQFNPSGSPAKRRNFWVSGGRLEEMCMEDGSLEKNGSRDEGVAGVRGAGDSGGGSSLM